MMDTKNESVGKVIRHLYRKIQAENEKSFTRRQFDYGKEESQTPEDLSDVASEKLMQTFTDEVDPTGSECERPDYVTGNEDEHEVHCDWHNDTVLCWPRTLRGTTAYLPCFDEYNGIKYDSSENATRHCFENGTWSSSNYSMCLNIEGTISESVFDESITGVTSLLYYIGYSVSVVALLFAMFIFLYFKDLRCLRNTIHTNLMFTYVMADFMWILTGILQTPLQQDMTMCMVLPLLLHYFHVTTFFWMFVEGLYLYMLVVETFNRTNIRTLVYVFVGWGIPLILIIIWGIVKALTPIDEETANTEFSGILSHCHWMNGTVHDWIFKVPVLTVMALNSVFLVMIMWVLITKLRSANNAETQQYRKATKALLVLIPLLGMTYILTIVSPTEGVVAQVFYNMRAFMLSFQGFLVALFYCFLNSEVQNTIRHRMESWRTVRTLGDKRYNYSRDWSPRSRTESMRLYSQPTITPYKKRESCTSEITTTTTVLNSSVYNNNGSRVSNGSTSGTSIAHK